MFIRKKKKSVTPFFPILNLTPKLGMLGWRIWKKRKRWANLSF